MTLRTALAALLLAACRNAASTPAAPDGAPATIPPAVSPCLAAGPDTPDGARLERARARAQRTPGSAEQWTVLGRAWLDLSRRSGDPGFALNAGDCASRALGIEPTHTGALGVQAALALGAHEFTRARALAEQVVARVPDDMLALGTLSDAALELGDIATAERTVQRLIDIEPGLSSYSRAGHLRWLHGHIDGALEMMRLAIDAAGDPKESAARAFALTQAAMVFWHEGDTEGAKAGFDMALGVHPEYAAAWLGRGHVLRAQADPAGAASAYRKALAIAPELEAAASLAQILTELGDDAGAVQARAEVERIGRHDRRGLSLYYSTHAVEPERALTLAEAEYGVRPDVYCEDALAWALHRRGQTAAALRHIENARRLGTRDARLIFHEGAIRLAAGEKARGRALLEQALAQNPHFDAQAAAEARRLLGAAS